MKYLGASYYPESWGIDRVAVDIKLMKDAGMNIVRLGEFAWSTMEKNEGEYDFTLFIQAINMFAENKIDVLMCTPSAAPPAWVSHNYPETLLVDAVGTKAIHGVRQHNCYSSAVYRGLCARITDEMTKALKDCGNIVAWQIDNELGRRSFGPCYCDSCKNGFREYLKQRYKSIDNLNSEWKNEFWSMDYSHWDEILIGFEGLNLSTSRVLESRRFYDTSVEGYMREQLRIIRKNIPGTLVTTNNPSPQFDLYSLFRDLDFCAGDFYWNHNDNSVRAAQLARYYSYKEKKIFVAETGLGYNGMELVEPKAARLNMWRSFACGAESYILFRWRPPLGGRERTLSCMVTHAGVPRKTYTVAQQMFNEVNKLKERLKGLKTPEPLAAVLLDSDVQKFYKAHRFGEGTYNATSRGIIHHEMSDSFFKQLHSRNIPATFIAPDRSLDRFKLLILPSQTIIRADLSEKIKKYVEDGGVVIAMGELNTSGENGACTINKWPEHLSDVFGIYLHSGVLVRPNDTKPVVSGKINGEEINSSLGVCWIGDVEAKEKTRTMLSFSNSIYQDQAVFTHNKYGKGHAFYLGVSDIEEVVFARIMQLVIDHSGIKYFKDCPVGVEIIDCKGAVFIINQNDQAAEFEYAVDGEAVTGCFDNDSKLVTLDAYDMCIIRRY